MTKLLSTLILTLLVVACFGVASGAEYTVGSGGDYGTLGGAIADASTGAADTLIVLAGTHVAQADSVILYENMKLRGLTTDASLYIIMNASRSLSAIDVSQNGVVIANLTFRDERAGTFDADNKAMIEVDDDATLIVRRCYFRDVDGVTAPGLYCLGDGAGAEVIDITFEDCYAESCTATAPTGGKSAGVAYVKDANAITIDGCIFVGNNGEEHGGALKFEYNYGETNISNSLFVGNVCGGHGAAAFVSNRNGYDTTVDYCTFDANTSSLAEGGQVYFGNADPTHTLSHSIISNGGSTYALSNLTATDVVSHVDSYNNGVDNLGWNSPACADTLHVPPEYNTLIAATGGYGAGADGVWRCKDDSYMGWWQYVPQKPRLVSAVRRPAQDGHGGARRTPGGRR